jgi:glycosyltransferase involved in cell wall biosynthesis
VHDLRPYFEPDTWVQKFYFHRMLGRALHRCDGILTVSQTSKRDIVEVYGISEQKIYVVPNVVDLPSANLASLSNPIGNGVPYLLMVGASWKHKNAMEVLEEHDSWGRDFRLKILAGTGQYGEELRERAANLGISKKVDFFSAASEEDLADLYRGCTALVYPSRMEGFGLPPLEAMAYGKPVIVSDIPVFRELFGDAPYFVALGDSASWKVAMSELLHPGSDSQIRHCREGLAVASKYSRERMCAALTASLESIWGIGWR